MLHDIVIVIFTIGPITVQRISVTRLHNSVRRWNRMPRRALAARYAVPLPDRNERCADPEMSDASPPTAEYYRSMAEEIGQLAEKSRSPEVRRELLDLVERFTRMAAHIERRHPDRAGQS